MTHAWGPRTINFSSFAILEDDTSRSSLDHFNTYANGMPRDGGIPLGELVEAQPADGILHSAGSGGGALQSTQDNEALVWALHDQLCQKAVMLAQLHGHRNMEYFCLSQADLKELGNDERRIMRLRM